MHKLKTYETRICKRTGKDYNETSRMFTIVGHSSIQNIIIYIFFTDHIYLMSFKMIYANKYCLFVVSEEIVKMSKFETYGKTNNAET